MAEEAEGGGVVVEGEAMSLEEELGGGTILLPLVTEDEDDEAIR